MEAKKWAAVGVAALLLVGYNGGQSGIIAMRKNENTLPGTKKKERYGPSLQWLDRLRGGQSGSLKKEFANETKLDFNVLSSMMIAGLAPGFKSQVANLLWMKSDEYWHKGLLTRQVPLMEAVVTLDPQFIDAWSTAGWHWAYNIYADLPQRPDLSHNRKALEKEQDKCVLIGLDYLNRGANMNPETYRLWFENAWTRGEKGGILDEETVNLLRISRQQKDARELERTVADASGKPKTEMVQGDDLVGRNIGHVFEKIPDIDKALNEYSILISNGRAARVDGKTLDPSRATGKPLPAAEEAGLAAAGRYWGLYGRDYTQIVEFYRSSDSVVKAQIKKLVPDTEQMDGAQKAREKMQGYESQATGAYISITARYLPAWKLMQAGKLDEAVETIIGVMNADGIHHVQKMPVLAKVFELRGDAPQVIQQSLDQAKAFERESSQEIGLHFLGILYEKEVAAAKDATQKKAFALKAYETWYRARERNTLDFYARRKSLKLENDYNFSPPQAIIDEIKKSRKAGTVNAAPPPNVKNYQ